MKHFFFLAVTPSGTLIVLSYRQLNAGFIADNDHSCVSYLVPHSVGTPTSRQLPLYGSKVLALRNGTVDLHGMHKTPTWTKMAKTAGPGERSVDFMGDVSTTWAKGRNFLAACFGLLLQACTLVEFFLSG